MAYGLSNGHARPMTSRDPQKCGEAVWSAILATAWLLVRPIGADMLGLTADSTRQLALSD